MKKKVFIFGNKGNMGQRYSAILKYLGHDVSGTDIDETPIEWVMRFQASDAIIVASDTESHASIVENLIPQSRPILCEKPITKDLSRLKQIVEEARSVGTKLSMVSQYDWLTNGHIDGGPTVYDYFKSGKDGLAWDCINIIWHAKGKIRLANQSPFWDCQINGHYLDLSEMDYAYIHMIEDWLEQPYAPQYDRILNAHGKVLDFLNGKFN